MANHYFSEDTFFNGRIRIKQSRDGYRYSIDAVLLAAFARVKPRDTVVDLGTGCGIIPIMLAYRHPGMQLYGIEIQKALADLAKTNVKENGLDGRIHILRGDMKNLHSEKVPQTVDLVVSNPPYRKIGSGRMNPNRQRATARHEITVTLADVAQAAQTLLGKAGRVAMIYPAERAGDVIHILKERSIEPKYLRSVHSYADADARLVLIEGIKGGRPGLTIMAPLILYGKDGRYTDVVQQMFEPWTESKD
jgi:tRNA1Val (adenine37-N6)-methyltransferase